jgi:hypothetical protein
MAITLWNLGIAWSYLDQSRPCPVLGDGAPFNSDEWEWGFVPAGALTLKSVRVEPDVLRKSIMYLPHWEVFI